MSAIVFKSLCKRYAPKLPLTINDANLSIAPGEFCVFVGPSGCGKSTLLRMVAGLEVITSGELLIDGQAMQDLPPAKRGVAMVFQSYALYPHMTVSQNMAFALEVMGADKAAIKQKVLAAAEILQLTPLLDRLPKALSGGQRQRVAIGRAIVKEPKVFLFDEPLSNLDAALRAQTRLELAKLHKDLNAGERKTSMIYVTHDQVEAMTLADKIVLLHTGELIDQRGSIAQVGSPMQLYHEPNSRFVAEFIGSPKMNILPATVSAASANHVQLSLAEQSYRVAVKGNACKLGETIQLGIRPEHISLSATGLPAQLSHVERLGDQSLLYCDIGNGAPLVTVKIEGDQCPNIGSQLHLAFQPERLHAFDLAGLALTRC
jgi:multiple sugar transport system ATP-binding protein